MGNVVDLDKRRKQKELNEEGVLVSPDFKEVLSQIPDMDPAAGVCIWVDQAGEVFLTYGGQYDISQLKRLLEAGLAAIAIVEAGEYDPDSGD